MVRAKRPAAISHRIRRPRNLFHEAPAGVALWLTYLVSHAANVLSHVFVAGGETRVDAIPIHAVVNGQDHPLRRVGVLVVAK
jgi:hypothetical protein